MLHANFSNEIEKIWTILQSELAGLEHEKKIIKRFDLSRRATEKAIKKLEDVFASAKEFDNDPAALVSFNRNLAPPFYARFIFFSKVFAFECLKADTDPRDYEVLFEPEHTSINRFFQKYTEFRRYYLSGATDRDALYYLQGPYNIIYLDDLVVGISPDVNTGCLLLAYIEAFEAFRSYLLDAARQDPTELVISDLQWTALPSDLNEVAIALTEYIKKGGQKASIKEVTEAFGRFLKIDLSNSSQLDNKRRNRLEEEPNFLEKLAAKSIQRKEKLSENQNSRKRRG